MHYPTKQTTISTTNFSLSLENAPWGVWHSILEGKCWMVNLYFEPMSTKMGRAHHSVYREFRCTRYTFTRIARYVLSSTKLLTFIHHQSNQSIWRPKLNAAQWSMAKHSTRSCITEGEPCCFLYQILILWYCSRKSGRLVRVASVSVVKPFILKEKLLMLECWASFSRSCALR